MAFGKGEIDLRLNLDLSEPILGDFDRIFRRPDLDVGRVDESQDRV